jgi:hypothetical protein
MARYILLALLTIFLSCGDSSTNNGDQFEWVQVASAPQQCIPPTYNSLQQAVEQLTVNGIAVFDSRRETFPVCQACTCPTGIVFKAQINSGQVSQALQLGWELDDEGDDTAD